MPVRLDSPGSQTRILAEAQIAYDAAALLQWERDGKQDCGSCGGYMLGYKGNTKFAKELLARGAGHRMGTKVYLIRRLPNGIRTQHMEVEVKACEAFRAVTAKHGIIATEARSYVD